MRTPSLSSLKPGLFLIGGTLLIGFISAQRLPGIYNTLWEDEIHHHYPVLCSPTFVQMRRDIVYQNKAVLDYAVRRMLFRSSLLATSERNLHLVSWVISALHMALFLFYPWSKKLTPRFIAALCLAANGLEMGYATEAQYYALSSLMGTLPFLALHWSFKKSWSGAPFMGAAGLGLALFLSANTNYFNAPLVAMIFIFYAATVMADPALEPVRKSLALLWGVCGLVFGRWSFWLNKYSWRQMRSAPMVPAQHPTFSLLKNSYVLNMNYTLMAIPGVWFYGWMGCSLINRRRAERYLAFALAAALLVVKPLFYAYYSYRSDLGLYDRYTMMYVGPAALAVGLGVSSLMNWADWGVKPVILRRLLCLAIWSWPLFFLRARFENTLTSVPRAISLWRSMPANYSRDFLFFKHVQALRSPLLILIDHDWCSDIPLMYLQSGIMGLPYKEEVLTLDTGKTPDWPTRAAGFLTQHRQDGYVVYYFERPNSHAGACRSGKRAIFEWPADTGCLGIFPAQDFPGVPPIN